MRKLKMNTIVCISLTLAALVILLALVTPELIKSANEKKAPEDPYKVSSFPPKINPELLDSGEVISASFLSVWSMPGLSGYDEPRAWILRSADDVRGLLEEAEMLAPQAVASTADQTALSALLACSEEDFQAKNLIVLAFRSGSIYDASQYSLTDMRKTEHGLHIDVTYTDYVDEDGNPEPHDTANGDYLVVIEVPVTDLSPEDLSLTTHWQHI